MIAGKQSIKFDNNVYIKAGATVAGTKEKKGPLGCCFDVVSQDDLFGDSVCPAHRARMRCNTGRSC